MRFEFTVRAVVEEENLLAAINKLQQELWQLKHRAGQLYPFLFVEEPTIVEARQVPDDALE